MATRREFLQSSAAALAVTATRPIIGWQGANDRVRMGVIGMGTRAARVFDSLTRNQDCQFVTGCEVNTQKQATFQAANRPFAKFDVVKDYRRVLDRNDIDAVLIATPDFSHSKIFVDALAAGKHVYVEKPISNSSRASTRCSTPTTSIRTSSSRSARISAAGIISSRRRSSSEKLDPVTHVLIQQPGAYSAQKQDPVPGPDYLDWDDWQVDAPKKAFKQGYLGFRGWWEYGSGMVGDWGAHHVDVANWFLDADHKQPLKTTALGFYSSPNIDPECVFNTFSIAWQFDTHIMTFANSVYPRPNFADPKAPDIEGWGVFFFAGNGTLQVNRMGWALRPPVADDAQSRRARSASRSGQRAARHDTPAAAPAAAPAADRGRGGAGGPGGPGGGRGGGKPPVELNVDDQSARRRGRGLSAARPHARFPRQAEGEEPRHQRAARDRLQLGAAVPARARSDAAEPRLGWTRAEEQRAATPQEQSCSVRQDRVE